MGMNVASLSGREPEALMDVNTTPLLDVMLVLLVMLIITIPTQLHVIKLDIGGDKSLDEPRIHVVAIDFDGTVYWDDQALPNLAAVDRKMQQVGAIAAADQPEVQIKPNGLLDYGVAATVMASAQRHGVSKMGLVGSEPYGR